MKAQQALTKPCALVFRNRGKTKEIVADLPTSVRAAVKIYGEKKCFRWIIRGAVDQARQRISWRLV